MLVRFKNACILLFLNCFKLCFCAWNASNFNNTSLNLLNKDDRGNHLSLLERLRFTFTPNGRREFVPRDQGFPLFFASSLLLLRKNE